MLKYRCSFLLSHVSRLAVITQWAIVHGRDVRAENEAVFSYSPGWIK